MIKFIKKSLFSILGLNAYLSLLQKIYLIGYKTGYLKSNKNYVWHYFVKKLLRPDDVIVDIGANLGYFTYIFINTINDDGHVYTVEPVEAYRTQLKKIIKDNASVTLLPFALGDKNEPSITLGMPSAFDDLGYLRHGVVTLETEERTVSKRYQFTSQLKKGSEVFGNLEKVDYIKCDIEGHEAVVLREMREILEKHKPLVQLETWGEQLPLMLQYFSSMNFTAYHLSEGKLINATKVQINQLSSSDVLFVHDKRFNRISHLL